MGFEVESAHVVGLWGDASLTRMLGIASDPPEGGKSARLKVKPIRLFAVVLIVVSASSFAFSQKWQKLKHQPSFETDTALLLTDGTVMVHEYNSPHWWRLTPDKTGSYLNGTWSKLGSMSSSYAPLYFASAILPDGKVIVEGGEYNFLNQDETNLGAIYDPTTNKWENVNPPSGWNEIGDSPGIVLADGTFMLGQNFTTTSVLFDEKNLTWNTTGSGKADSYAEEGFALLPDTTVLTVDTQRTPNAEKYYKGKWIGAGNTIQSLANNSEEEIGPELLRPEGTVFAMGANGSGAGHTAIYTPPSKPTQPGTWKKGPDFPNGDDMADAPAAILPNGNVLCDTSPGVFLTPLIFYEFDGTKFTRVPGPAPASTQTSYTGRMLVLPTGQILYLSSDGETIDVELYSTKGGPKKEWAPTISSVPTSISRGSTYQISGTQFNGLTGGAAYGDDAQMNTNYGLVRITNNSTKHVFYARTHDPSTMGVATGKKKVTTMFDVPSGMETGASSLVVVANGIASAPAAVTVQ